jgi:transcriptional regulator
MYTPKHNLVTDVSKISDLVRAYPFGILINAKDNKPAGTHLPFLLPGNAEPGEKLLSHMARMNPQLKDVEDNSEVLTIFNGPHTFISSSWYKVNDGIPTWNYASVHIYGRLRIITDVDEVMKLLKQTIATFDPPTLPLWEDAKHLEYFRKHTKGVVAFEIAITSVEAKWKMSQNRTEEDQKRVVDALLTQRTDEESHKVAGMVKRNV